MIDHGTLLSIPFLKKSRFTGSDRGMRYSIYKIEEENETLKTYLSNAVIDREKYKVMLKKSEEVRKKLCEEKIYGSN